MTLTEQPVQAYAIILQQLGGRRFQVMTGANTFSFSDAGNTITFRIPRAQRKITHVSITLTPLDLYKVTFRNVRKTKTGHKNEVVAMVENVYADKLQSVFTEYTGLETHL